MKNINTTHENGVALIFALGLLTLMSVLGVAFVTNSLTAQKTAVNIGAKNHAQILMDSAVNRLMISLMGIALQAPGGANDYSTIYSTAVAGKKGDSGTTWDQLDEYSGNSPANELKNSKLSTSSGVGLPEYDGSKSNANWVYVRDKGGYVIGRMAYQVLPVGRSSMSLDQVLLGIYNHDKTDSTNLGKPGTSSVQYPWNVRIGKDIREFNIGKAFANGDAPFKLEWKYDGSNDADNPYYKAQFPGNIYSPPDYTQDNPFRAVENFEKFFAGLMFQNIVAQTDAEKKTQQINWFKHWFNESKNAYREVFLVSKDAKTKMENAEPFFRFNLSDLAVVSSDKWYDRFKNSGKKNASEVVEELLGSAEPWIEMKKSPKTGIPFLNRIGGNKGSFKSIDMRRRQIAANLNDYCDSDSIPTSDVPAAEWSNTKMPQYTGNEKTPYINEFALGFKMDLTKSGELGNINIKLTPEILTELIDIYGVTGASTTGKYNIKLWFKKNLTLKVVNASGNVTYSDNSTEAFSEVSCDSNGGNTEAELNSYEIEVASSNFSKGYFVARKELPVVNLSFDGLKSTIEAKLNDKGEKAVSKVEYTSLELEVSEIKFDLAAAALFDKTDASKEAYGIDFVRGPGAEIVSGSAKTVRLKTAGTGFEPVVDSGEKSNAWQYFYLTGMEVRDPRQNLNFTKNTTEDKDFVTAASDWKAVPVIEHNFKKSDGDDKFKVGTIEIDYTQTTPSYAGVVNSCSNPSAPFNDSDNLYKTGSAGSPGVDYDKEKVEDPAWLGESTGADEKHLSTAFIRNAPMQSLWELGVIHRAMPWQTINLKRAVVPVSESSDAVRRIELTDFSDKENAETDSVKTNIAYTHGDAVLLDQVKLTDDMKSSGKLDVNMLFEDPARYNLPADWNKNIAKALFYNISIGQQVGDLYDSTKIGTTGTKFDDWGFNRLNSAADFLTNKEKDSDVPGNGMINSVIPHGRNNGLNQNKYISRADFIEGPYDPASPDTDISEFPRTLACGFGLMTYNDWAQKSDAQQEEIIGKTANLITVGSTPQTSINAIVVVQTIKPIKVAQDTVVVKEVYKKNGTKVSRDEVVMFGGTLEPDINLPALKISADKSFKFGRFKDSDDKNSFIYWDEITSELRALVTIKEHTDSDGSTRFQLSNIKYLGN